MSIQTVTQKYLFTFSLNDIGLLTAILVSLNFLDVILSVYAIRILNFVELNPLAIGFPVWIFVLKFSVCFIPMVCAYTLDKFEIKNYLFLPFIFLAILIQIYAFIIGFNLHNILGM